MIEKEYDYIFKVLLVGNSVVGKSSLILRYVEQIWNDVFVPTIGVDFKLKSLEIKNKSIKLQIWDTEGKKDSEMLYLHILRVQMESFLYLILHLLILLRY